MMWLRSASWPAALVDAKSIKQRRTSAAFPRAPITVSNDWLSSAHVHDTGAPLG